MSKLSQTIVLCDRGTNEVYFEARFELANIWLLHNNAARGTLTFNSNYYMLGKTNE